MTAGDQLRYSVPRASCCAFTRTTGRPRCSMTRHRGGFPPHLPAPSSPQRRSFELLERGGPRLVHFAAVNDRNGFFLLSREPRPRFAWSALVGRTVISFGGAPTPWLCMQAVLRRHGVDPARVTFIRELSTPDAVATFRSGQAHFLEHGPPVVDQLIADGTGHLVASMGEATGPVPFSSFMATPQMLRRERDVFVRFVRGLSGLNAGCRPRRRPR